jgi:hypothetical protein
MDLLVGPLEAAASIDDGPDDDADDVLEPPQPDPAELSNRRENG